MTLGILLLVGVLFAFGLVSLKLEHSMLTGPMVFVGLGLAVAGMQLFTPVASENVDTTVRFLAKITLVLVLFTDASRIAVRSLFKEHRIVLRLLFVALPISITLGAFIGEVVFGGAGFITWLLCAAILAPTDAALGQAVVSLPQLPLRIRQTLNAESGLNDGIVLPVVLLFVALSQTEALIYSDWIVFITKQLVLGPLIGAVLGYGLGALIQWATTGGYMNAAFQRLTSLAMALVVFLTAETVHSNGFIAVFVAGLVLGNFFKRVCSCLYEFAEAEGMLLALVTFFAFGVWTVPQALDAQTSLGYSWWQLLLYATLMLTVMRTLPVYLASFRLQLDSVSKLFIGWFGPRGLASVLFMMIIVSGEGVSPNSKQIVYSLVTVTVLVSVIAHGVTAYPLSVGYANHIKHKHDMMNESVSPDHTNPTRFGQEM